MEHLAAADHEHSAFVGDVPQRRLPGRAGVCRRRQVDLLALRIERLAGKRVGLILSGGNIDRPLYLRTLAGV